MMTPVGFFGNQNRPAQQISTVLGTTNDFLKQQSLALGQRIMDASEGRATGEHRFTGDDLQGTIDNIEHVTGSMSTNIQGCDNIVLTEFEPYSQLKQDIGNWVQQRDTLDANENIGQASSFLRKTSKVLNKVTVDFNNALTDPQSYRRDNPGKYPEGDLFTQVAQETCLHLMSIRGMLTTVKGNLDISALAGVENEIRMTLGENSTVAGGSTPGSSRWASPAGSVYPTPAHSRAHSRNPSTAGAAAGGFDPAAAAAALSGVADDRQGRVHPAFGYFASPADFAAAGVLGGGGGGGGHWQYIVGAQQHGRGGFEEREQRQSSDSSQSSEERKQPPSGPFIV